MKKTPKRKLIARHKRSPDSKPVVTTDSATETPQTTPVPPGKGVKKAKRPPIPQSFSFALQQVLVAEWYEEGMRFAAGKVEHMRYVWSEEQERWLENLELVLFPALESRRHVTLVGTHGRWMGPRTTGYELREPNGKEKTSAEAAVIRVRSATTVEPKVTLGTGKLKSVEVNGQAAQIQTLIKRKGGASMKELREVAPRSAGSVLSSLRKKGLNITMTRNTDGSKTYEVRGL